MKKVKMMTGLYILSSIAFGNVRTDLPAYRVRVHAFTGYTTMAVGHVYIEITNNTNGTLPVGFYTLGPRASVTIGLWSTKGKKYDIDLQNGVNYNVESHYIYHNSAPIINNDGNSDIYLETYVDSTSFKKANDIIKSWNRSYDLIVHNCATFGIAIWNALTPKDVHLPYTLTPQGVRNDMLKKQYHDTEYFNYGLFNFKFDDSGNMTIFNCSNTYDEK